MTKKEQSEKSSVHKELEGFDIKIDPFGNIKTNFPIERIKDFLDKNVEDKKIKSSQSQSEEE